MSPDQTKKKGEEDYSGSSSSAVTTTKYVTDAHLSGLARELRAKGIDCQTIHALVLGNEDSRVKITDPEIVKFLSERGGMTLITLDSELAEYCASFGIPCIRVQDVVIRYLLGV